MKEQNAVTCVAMLVANTSGWNDDSVDATIEMMVRRWDDDRCAEEATNHVINTWTRQGRPPWGLLHDAYRVAKRRRYMETPPALPSGTGTVVPPSIGRQLVARAYARQCRSRDPETDIHILSGFRTNEPNPAVLDAWLGIQEDAHVER